MSKYTQQFKLEVVQEFLKSGGLKKVAHIYQINHSDVRKWVLAYQAHGPDGLSHQRQNFTPEFKLKVLKYMAKHQISARPATAIFNIGDMATVLRWQKLYNEGGIAALQIKPKVSDRDLGLLLKDKSSTPQFQLQVSADKAVPYGRVAEIMAIAQANGVTKMSFVSVPTKTK